jgi:hypothetical protein
MRVSDSRRFLFVHVQKTGGVSISDVLDSLVPDTRLAGGRSRADGEGGLRHRTLQQILELEPGLADYWTFGFVRNPWARMWSWWSMFLRVQERAATGPGTARRLIASHPMWRHALEVGDFEQWLHLGPERFPQLARPQLDYLVAGDRRADFVGRTESMAEDVATVLRRLDLDVPGELPWRNRSDTRPYREHYGAAGRQRVAELFARDLEAFGYEF